MRALLAALTLALAVAPAAQARWRPSTVLRHGVKLDRNGLIPRVLLREALASEPTTLETRTARPVWSGSDPLPCVVIRLRTEPSRRFST